MKDSYGKDWSQNENDLDKFCKIHKLTHIVEYEVNRMCGSHLSAPHLDEGEVYCKTQVLKEGNGMKHYIVDLATQYPVSDEYVLLQLKNYFRNKKINELL